MEDKAYKELVQATADTLARHNGNIRATAKELGVSRSTIRRRLRTTGKLKKPLAGGTTHGFGTKMEVRDLPAEGEVKRYILTSMQNNTRINKGVWKNLLAFSKHYNAEIIIGTFTYNQNHFGPLSVKQGTHKGYHHQLWYDPTASQYINDKRIQLAPGLTWCGEYNALPTNTNPLAGLESYTGRSSSIFPHAKLAMRSIASIAGDRVKFNYTTGTITKKNYIQKREGVIAEFHHIYGGLLVEVDSKGRWFVRQLNNDEGTGTMQDLRVLVKRGKVVSTDEDVDSITHGDLHGTMANKQAVAASIDMLDYLKPNTQFHHDLFEGTSFNRHVIKRGADKNPHYAYDRWLRGFHRVEKEMAATATTVKQFLRPWCKSYAPDANHDAWWLLSWLNNYDYRPDPANARFFLDLQSYMYDEIGKGRVLGPGEDGTTQYDNEGPRVMARDVNVVQYVLGKFGIPEHDLKVLLDYDSQKVGGGKIEAGMHGHLGPNGTFASPENLSKLGYKANTAHTHSAGIWNGLYVAGTLSEYKWTYNPGPSAWSHSETLTYKNGKRTIITQWDDAWRA